jgi:cytochrome c553
MMAARRGDYCLSECGLVQRLFIVIAGACLLIPAGSVAQPGGTLARTSLSVLAPSWAYPVNPNMPNAPAADVAVRVPDSDRNFLPSQLQDLFDAPDWHPQDHSSMPDVVARGRKPSVYACGYCHLPDGSGRPENASLAGLPVSYVLEQLADFKTGARRTAVPERVPPQLMIEVAKSATNDEIKVAAEYFSSLQPHPRARVVEAAAVPSTHVAGWILVADTAAPKEPIGRRIIEIPEDLEQFEHRDTRARFVAYVPVGSVKAGEALVKSGGANRTLACTGCHGADLKGGAMVPSIAGRSPSYIVRQLFDIQSGSRVGANVAPMSEAVRHLRVEDMIHIAAYLATLN